MAARTTKPVEPVVEEDSTEEEPAGVVHPAVTGRPNDNEIREPFIPGSTFASRKRVTEASNKAVKGADTK